MTTEWLPLIVTITAAIMGLIAYARQKQTDRKNDLIALRRNEYVGFLNDLIRVIDSPEARSAYNERRLRLTVIASDDVLRTLGDFARYANEKAPYSTEEERIEFRRKLTTLIISMRRDCFDKTKLHPEEIEFLIPISV